VESLKANYRLSELCSAAKKMDAAAYRCDRFEKVHYFVEEDFAKGLVFNSVACRRKRWGCAKVKIVVNVNRSSSNYEKFANYASAFRTWKPRLRSKPMNSHGEGQIYHDV
jgi:hypothetical protein